MSATDENTPKKRGPKPRAKAPEETPASGEETAAPVVPAAPAPRGGVPPCPPADPHFGMKTPAVRAWWFEHHPKAAAERYAGLTEVAE